MLGRLRGGGAKLGQALAVAAGPHLGEAQLGAQAALAWGAAQGAALARGGGGEVPGVVGGITEHFLQQRRIVATGGGLSKKRAGLGRVA